MATTYSHLQDSTNKSPVWETMQHQCHYIPTPIQDLINKLLGWRTINTNVTTYTKTQTSRQLGTINTIVTTYTTPTRLDKQVAGVGTYKAQITSCQLGDYKHQCHYAYTRCCVFSDIVPHTVDLFIESCRSCVCSDVGVYSW